MKIRRPFRALVYVAVIVAAVGYMTFSAWRLPSRRPGTVIGAATANPFAKAKSTDRLRFPGWCAKPTPNGWVLLDVLSDADLDDPARKVVSIRRRHGATTWGLWHSLVEVTHDEVFFLMTATAQPFTDTSSFKDLLSLVHQTHSNVFPPDLIDFYAAGGGSTRRILWLGVLGDLSILAAFAAIIFSLVKLRREIRWPQPGHCANCDYDLAGLTTGKCPECGAAIAHQVLPPAS